MNTFSDTLILLFIIALIYILVYFLVTSILTGLQSIKLGGYSKKRAGFNENEENSEINEIENENEENEKPNEKNELESKEKSEECSCIEKCDCATKYLLLHYKKIAQFHPNAKDKIIVQLHSTEWCKYCKQMKPIWEEAISRIKNDPNLDGGFLFLEQNQDECNSPAIKTVPAIFKFKTGENSLKKYENVYDVDALKNWILNA